MREMEWTQIVAVVIGAPLGMALVLWGDVIMERIKTLSAWVLHVAKQLGPGWHVEVVERAKAAHGRDATQVTDGYYVKIRHRFGSRDGTCRRKAELTPLAQALYREIVAENTNFKTEQR